MDKNQQLNLLHYRANKLFEHIIRMIEDYPKYIFSDACEYNLKIYFQLLDKINLLKSHEVV
jgi:hypothetical protein